MERKTILGITLLFVVLAVGILGTNLASSQFNSPAHLSFLNSVKPGEIVHLLMNEEMIVKYNVEGDIGLVKVTLIGYDAESDKNRFKIHQVTTQGEVRDYFVIIGPNDIGLIVEAFKTSDTRSVVSVPISSIYLD